MSRFSQQKRVINIVDNVETINAGIWMAAISTADLLDQSGFKSELWFPGSSLYSFSSSICAIPLRSTGARYLEELIARRALDPQRDIIVTHGSWKFCTKWGFILKKRGFHWIYTPQGMLERWAMKQKRIKKWVYFSLFEKRMILSATTIRSVSSPEASRLSELFPENKVIHIPNGVAISSDGPMKHAGPRTYIFMARLHHKKGVLALAQAWLRSSLNNRDDVQLVIAGPDQGELSALRRIIAKSLNVKYVGMLFGELKEAALTQASFFVLPSFSEGFPTSVLEAMSKGLICLITPGCNLPEAIQKGVALPILPERKSLAAQLENTLRFSDEDLASRSVLTRNFVAENFSLQRVASMQKELYDKLLTTL